MWVLAFVFVLGLVVGSFLNVVLARLHTGESIVCGRSHCPRCQTTLAYRDLIPVVSYLWLKGRCRTCQQPIDTQYPVVELMVGVCFALEYLRLFVGWHVPPVALLHPVLFFVRDMGCFCALLVIFVYDLRHTLILDRVTLPVMGFVFFMNLWLGMPWHTLLLGALVVGGCFLFQFLISKGTWVGGGDVRLGVLMGLILGFPLSVVALFLAYVLGAVVAVYILIKRKKGLRSEMAFGPFLALATMLVLVFGEQLLTLYSSYLFL